LTEIDWNEFKEYKKYNVQDDKLDMVVAFIKSYYNIQNAREIYNMLSVDDIGQMLIEKREIASAEGLESFMFRG